MRRIEVKASRDYAVEICPGLLDRAGELLRPQSGADTAVIVAGEHVAALHAPRLRASLERAGFRVLLWTHPSGEAYKTLETYGALLSFLAREGVGRSDLLLALGGGVTGDLTGFAAATYQRGVDYAQIPTSLLAMVDSSVGGKTAVDLPEGKNLVGSFYQPLAVLCDPDLLETLPEEELRNGSAEIVKYAVLGDPALFDLLSKDGSCVRTERVIAHCIEMKRDLVAEDEFDRGSRQLLNLGHSFGHAIEACSNYSLRHGEAVAIGMATIARASTWIGLLPEDERDALLETLQRFRLPTRTEIPAALLLQQIQRDKKRRGDTISLIVPERIGACRILPVQLEYIPTLLRLGGIV